MRSLTKYDEFIVEKLILEQLLLESNVIYSSKFKKALTKLSDNEIAQKLLEIENQDLDVVSNFFDIKIDNDNILTFTPDRVAQQILLRTIVDDNQKIVFTKSRQEIRIGRAVRLLLTAYNFNPTAAAIETFVNEFRAVLSIMNDVFSRFEIVEGDDLGFWYNRRNYEFPHNGTLSKSCQAFGNLDWLEIYISNPQTVKLLMLKSENFDNKIIGRALLWTLDDGRQLMDSIYTSKDSDRNVFIEYGNAKGYLQMNYSDTFVAHINPGEFDQYPSVDNMNNWDPTTGKISNKSFHGSRSIIWSGE